ncbi:MAG TPA: hypothetical protein VFQ65_21240 [Kofleriaceae bacterium]|nr:hypothetical protein [Kofleriaceae bacterium]
MERAHLTAAVLGAIVIPFALVVVCREPAPAPPPATPASVVAVAPAPQPEPSVSAEPKRPQPPTRTVACLAPDVTLFAAEQSVVVCWPSGVCGDEEGAQTERPASPPASPLRVEAKRACTGAACDPLGPRLQRAVADADGDALHVSPDHTLVMVGDAVWNRARDRVIAPPAAKTRGWEHEGDLIGSELLGTHVLVARDWWPDVVPPPPWMPARGTILDANGRTVATIAIGHDLAASTLELGHDAFLVFDGAGGFSLVVAGEPTWFGNLVNWDAIPARANHTGDPALSTVGSEAQVNAVVLAGDPEFQVTEIDGTSSGKEAIERVAAEWCDEGGCHLAHLEISFGTDLHGKHSQYLRRSADNVYPQCQ